MNYVGQIAGSVLGRVWDMYNAVNPATLTGSIDVVVVRQPDGSFLSSPFHVRFGKLGVLRSAERVVDIEVNGEPVDLQMTLGENGEAFFIQELEESKDSQELSHYSADPLYPQSHPPMCENKDPALPPSPHLVHSVTSAESPTRRQRWLKRVARKKEGDAAEEKDSMPSACDSVYFSFSEIPDERSPSKSRNSFNLSDEEQELCPTSRSPSPKSDSELEVRVPNSPLAKHSMEWDWGMLPQVSRTDLAVPQMSQSAPPSPTNRDPPQLSPNITYLDDCLATVQKEIDPLSGAAAQLQDKSVSETVIKASSLTPDDMLSPDSQEVSLYFPNSEPHPPPPPQQSEETTEQMSNEDAGSWDKIREDNIALSLCGGLADTWDIPEDKFMEHQVSYSQFCQNPSLIEDPRLVLRIHSRFYNWATAAPIILCMQVFNQDLPPAVIEQLNQRKMPPRSRGWWFSWRRRDHEFQSVRNQAMNSGVTSRSGKEPLSNTQEFEEQQKKCETSGLENQRKIESEPAVVPAKQQSYQRSLRLTSEQIKSLNLEEGANEVVFSVCTKFQGTTRCRAHIFLWNSEDRIIVSDIDGTVTRSDALGHILPQLGKDWTQPGIVQLYRAIHMNGYRFIYCSARSVGLAELTKGYLQGVRAEGYTLPLGPLLLSPSSLFTALHREVIEKAPERFKISCLSDIRQLFTDPQPFYAAFGNRTNDVMAYKQVGVPESRIFTVNPQGVLTQELNPSFKSSYSALKELVNVMFPPLATDSVTSLLSSDFNSFSFWRTPVLEINEEHLGRGLLETGPLLFLK
ncbi:LOW QUALITY PROTEIN: phosphatidate phosphatase LPIN3-like [Bombina bombina]|uniref:LOW QUALITY PROTEIN: phosphatidate phosphatase LPIN3-like n=1 Tax=Bombina bombina TaxID=8345 RepID=UPI00235AFACF|nr:LOW QUALITY PROTEIN: phosphatidate phosphatase LPIN3-like [Bombina bombina]